MNVELSSPDKELWPEASITKADLWSYYERVAEHVLPHVADRPATLYRCPDGVEKGGWFQKDASSGMPDGVRTARLEGWEESDDGEGPAHLVVEDVATLHLLAQYGVVELHVGTSPVGDLDHPAEVVFDLDPPGRRDREVRAATRRVGALLTDELGLWSAVKSSGSKGFHVHVPLDGSDDVETVRSFARGVAELLAARHPDALTVEQRKAARDDRVFIDWLRNHPAQTAVAPWSPRRLASAPVAVPLDWSELSDGVAPDQHTITSVFRRLGQREDPWAGMRDRAQPLGDALGRLAELQEQR